MRLFESSDNQAISAWFQNDESLRWLESPWSDNELALIAKEENGRLFVAMNGDVVVGNIGAYLANKAHNFNHLSLIHVAPEYRKMGVASYMLKWIEQFIDSEYEWRTIIEPDNHAARRLMKSADWQFLSSIVDQEGYLTYKKVPNCQNPAGTL